MNPKEILPDYPRTHHFYYRPNATRTDLIYTEQECKVLFETDEVYCEEKVDAASVGLNYDGNFLIRNRNNFLNKGKTGHLRTAAKIQFAPIYNWCYENREKFEKLNDLCGFNASIYAEWMYALHGIIYDCLPTYLITYDIYDWEKGYYINTGLARDMLSQAGFSLPTLLHKGKVPSCEYLEKFMAEKSTFSTVDLREGIYFKVCDKNKITHRFKWVRSDFIQGEHWSQKQITKNQLAN